MVEVCKGGSDTSYLNGHCRCGACKELARAYRKRKYYERHEENKQTLRRSYQANREVRLEGKLRQAYGISKAQWYEILEAQGGTCAICDGGPECGPSASDSKFHVDHCHETGRVRGLLCAHCNRAIGLLKDSAAIARAAADYLE